MRSRSAITSTAFVVCAAPVLLASHSAPAVPPTTACSLLTSEQVKGAIGVDIGPSKSIVEKACQWRQPVKPGDPGAIVDVTIIDLRRYAIGKAVGSSKQFKIVLVSGLGDEAYYSETADGKTTDLRVRKGEGAFAVHVWGAGVPIPQLEPKELALAKLIVTKF